MNKYIEKALSWAKKLEFSDDWLAASESYNFRDDYIIPFDQKNKELNKRKDIMLNLVTYLNYCDMTQELYQKQNLPLNIMYATLREIKIWAYRHKEVYGQYGLVEINWLRHNVSANLFRIGRLQYKLGKALIWSRKHKLMPGNKIIEIHIPRDGKVDYELCSASYSEARLFFQQYFPEYKYKYYTCGSWMLDNINLPTMLSEDSNIIKFQNDFDILIRIRSFDCIRFVFGEKYNKKNIGTFNAESSLQKKLQNHIISGKKCYVGYGVLKK